MIGNIKISLKRNNLTSECHKKTLKSQILRARNKTSIHRKRSRKEGCFREMNVEGDGWEIELRVNYVFRQSSSRRAGKCT